MSKKKVQEVQEDPEFWTILKSPSKKQWTTEEELVSILSAEIAKEIDAELIERIKRKISEN